MTSVTINTETGEEMSSLDTARSTPFAQETASDHVHQPSQNTVFRSNDGGASTRTSHTAVSEADLAVSSSPLDSARTDFGRAVPRSEVTAKTIVNVPGFGTMRCDSAAACGLIAVDPATGRYVDLPTTAQEPASSDQQEKEAPAHDPESVEGQQQFLNDLAVASPEVVGDMYNAAIEGAVAGNADNIDPATVAQLLNISEAQAATHIHNVRESYQQAADAAVKSVGINDLASFYDFCRSDRASALREAVSRLADGEGAEAFASMARDYLARGNSAGFDGDDFLDADYGDTGVTATRHADGLVYLTIPRVGVVEARAAMRNGLVKVAN